MDLYNTTQEDLINNEELITAYLKEAEIDSTRGTAVNSLVAKPGAAIFSAMSTEFRNALNNLDIQTAEDKYAEKLLKNYGLTPKSAGKGEGYLIVFTDTDDDLVVRNSVTFRAGGYTLYINRDYIGSTSFSELSSAVYVPLKPYGEGLYYMMIEAFTTTDLDTPLLPGTEITSSQSITGVTGIEVATAFVATSRSLTLDDLKEEVTNGVSAKILAGPDHIKAKLMTSSDIPVLDTSVVGMNDAEMLRDSNNIYGTSSGGYVDIYAKTIEFPYKKEVVKKASIVGDSRYKIFINKDDAAGFYYIDSVSYKENTKTSDMGMFDYTFGVDTTDAIFVPNFPKNRDGRFSAFQNCSVEFEYTGVPEDDTEPEFTVDLIYSPSIDAIQNFVSDPLTRTPAADYLVKAAVPLFLSVAVNIAYNPSADRPDESTIKQAIASTINSIPMGQRFLSGAEIACAVTAIYPDTVVKLPVGIDAFIIDNEGSLVHSRSVDTLEIPFMPERGISAKTSTFMISPSDVSVGLIGDKR